MSPAGFAHFIQEQQQRLEQDLPSRDPHGRLPGHPADHGGRLETRKRAANYGSGEGRPPGSGGADLRFRATIATARDILTDYARTGLKPWLPWSAATLPRRPSVCRLGTARGQRFAAPGRQDFSFQSGVWSPIHQVKGLEFSAVMGINPPPNITGIIGKADAAHVVFTRAADHLWIIGDQPMAYGIDRF